MSDFKSLFNRYASGEWLDCKKYLSHHIMTNRIERPSEYLMDEFARRALELEAEISALREMFCEANKALHYPKCWDTMAYPTIIHAIKEVNRCTQCQDVKLEKSHLDHLNDIYGAVNGRDMLEIFEITQKIPDPAEFGRIAKELHSQAVKPFVPGALRLCQNVFAEINKPTTANDGEWTE